MLRKPALFVLGLILACSVPGTAQEGGNWFAASSTAKAVTGDLGISTYSLSIGFSRFPLAQIRPLTPSEILAAFDADSSTPGAGHLYRIDIPATKKFQHHNSLCGDQPTEWMVTFASGRSLQVAFFSGEKPPALTPDALNNAPNLCGTYTYSR